jgi:hypothetical protein
LISLYAQNNQEQEGQNTWWKVGTMIGNMFVGDEERRRLLK